MERNSKALIRKEVLSSRRAMNLEEWNIYSKKICDKICELPVWKESGTVLLYYHYNNEVSTIDLFNKAIADKKTVAFPRSIIIDGIPTLHFYCITDINQLSSGYKGIMEPIADDSKLIKDADLCIVPFVAASPDCYRIGYGKGFYDRFLSFNNIGSSIGIGFDLQIRNDIVPDEFDFQLDMIITENYLYERKNDFK